MDEFDLAPNGTVEKPMRLSRRTVCATGLVGGTPIMLEKPQNPQRQAPAFDFEGSYSNKWDLLQLNWKI